jgi:DNA-binding LacI/PurR family transcriptional regulator
METQFYQPPLSTIYQDFAALGEVGVEHLLNMIHRPGTASTRYVSEANSGGQKEYGFYFENQSRIFAR